DGQTLRAGAVAAVQRIRNPIRLARAVLEDCEHMMLVGEGAEVFAAERGLALCDPDRKSTRLNSSHGSISYAVFCLKKKTTQDVLEPCHRQTRSVSRVHQDRVGVVRFGLRSHQIWHADRPRAVATMNGAERVQINEQ